MKNYLIKLLGGYTITDIKLFKKLIKKYVKELPTNKRLKEAEKELVRTFRTDAVFIQAFVGMKAERKVK